MFGTKSLRLNYHSPYCHHLTSLFTGSTAKTVNLKAHRKKSCSNWHRLGAIFAPMSSPAADDVPLPLRQERPAVAWLGSAPI